MMMLAIPDTIASNGWLAKTINYEIVTGNALWRFVFVLIAVLLTMVAGRIIQFFINAYVRRKESKFGTTVSTVFFKCLTKPVFVAVLAIGLYLCKLCLIFEDKTAIPVLEGINANIGKGWTQIAKAIAATAVAYGLYQLVDIIEYYLKHWTSKTVTKLDNMLVPAVRKSLRITIAIIATIYIVDNILNQNVRSILLGAGVGGVAIALAAKETIANFFGSITIFADRPFQIDEFVKIGEYAGPIEDVGFRSTRIRTAEGHLVTIPNSVIANSMVDNIGRRPFIRRTSNITITYDSGHTKAAQAVQIIKDILAGVPEINTDPDKSPRVYFSDFKEWSLNIYMSYWVKPPDDWLYQQVNERVNIEIMKQFETNKIEFAFPSQTLYVKKT